MGGIPIIIQLTCDDLGKIGMLINTNWWPKHWMIVGMAVLVLVLNGCNGSGDDAGSTGVDDTGAGGGGSVFIGD